MAKRPATPTANPSITIADLKPAPFNENIRSISVEADAGLAKSLKNFGDLSGLVWNRRTGNMVSGHQRLRHLKTAHGDALTIEIDRAPANGEDGEGAIVTPTGTRWHLRIVDWDDETEQIANITANNAAITGTFTTEAAEMVRNLTDQRPDLVDDLLVDKVLQQLNDDIESARRESGGGSSVDDGTGPPEMELQPFEHYDYVLVVAKTIQDWNFLVDRLGLDKVNASPIAGKKKIGLGRAVDAKRVIALISKA